MHVAKCIRVGFHFIVCFSCIVLVNASFSGPDFLGKGISGHYSQYSMDYARILA